MTTTLAKFQRNITLQLALQQQFSLKPTFQAFPSRVGKVTLVCRLQIQAPVWCLNQYGKSILQFNIRLLEH